MQIMIICSDYKIVKTVGEIKLNQFDISFIVNSVQFGLLSFYLKMISSIFNGYSVNVLYHACFSIHLQKNPLNVTKHLNDNFMSHSHHN